MLQRHRPLLGLTLFFALALLLPGMPARAEEPDIVMEVEGQSDSAPS